MLFQSHFKRMQIQDQASEKILAKHIHDQGLTLRKQSIRTRIRLTGAESGL